MPGGGDLVFQPSEAEFLQRIEGVVGGFVESISLVNRLLTYEGLQVRLAVVLGSTRDAFTWQGG